MKTNKNGGAILFLCIILSAVILSQSILFRGALMRSDEVEIARSAQLQAENVLCNYNQMLLEHYGIYCFEESALNRKIFDECCRVKDIESIQVTGESELSVEELERIINDYMKLRFPAMLGNELIGRIGKAVGHIEESDLFKKASADHSGNLKKYLGEYLSSADKWSEILENIENFIHVVDFADKLSDFEDFVRDLKDTMKRSGTYKLQGEYDSFHLDIFDPESIDALIDVLSFAIDSDVPDYFSYLYINKYAASLFDSNISQTKDGTLSQDETNIYGTSFSAINGSNKADLEYLLTGKEEKEAVNIVETLVFSTRALLNIGTFLVDKDKLDNAEGIAAILAVCIGLISGGSVILDPSVVKYFVIVTWAIQKSFQELETLTDGGTVTLIDHSSLNDQPGIKVMLMTRYRDYLELFLMFVDRKDLLTRMIDVFERYTGGDLYVSVQTTVLYAGREFCHEEKYDSYKS
ncbi:MAG: DUF5702 domain-containing protein [Oscillospiraceae bacterium]|nr:DUF5702 domain-containing protein [Oscillospiraceae bacterium]